MKLFSVLLAFVFSFSAMAQVGGKSLVKDLVNEYQYDLTVGWDQKDQEVLKSLYADFQNKILDAMKEGQITEHDLADLIRAWCALTGAPKLHFS